jgi:osmotically-inducible protein OsmY
MNLTRILASVSIVFLVAACDSHSPVESIVPQEAALANTDPDAALADKVEKALGTDDAPLAFGVEVTARDGKVELWGTVDSHAARKRFELIAAGVVGVKSLENHLKVDPGA